ncbi:MAG: hypothetical protein IAE91_09400 [Ignavibacteriaceae bacterium]|nr:hypothetical protein [Ignavibacteriaceae bacterium]
MIIHRVSTDIFIKEYETRGSNPSQFNCSDKNDYVVKHARSGSYRPLINELIAVLLLNQLEIITPDFALVEINDEIFSPDYSFIRGKPNGLGFGSKFISNSKYVIDFSIIEKIMI